MTQILDEIGVGAWNELTGALPGVEGFAALVESLRQGRSGAVDGAWGSAPALTAAALGAFTSSTILLVIPHPADVDSWAEDVATFAGLRPVLFPAWDRTPGEDAIDEVQGQRLRVLSHLNQPSPSRFVLTTIQAILQPTPSKEELAHHRRVLRKGDIIEPDKLLGWLLEQGLTRRETVELAGEFARRGGIVDVFPVDADGPYRLEFFGDELESIRQFAPETQRSREAIELVEISGLPSRTPGSGGGVHLTEHLPQGAWVILVEPNELHEQGKHYLERVSDPRGLFSVEGAFRGLVRLPSVTISTMPVMSTETTCHLRVESVERFSGDVTKVREELDAVAADSRVLIACHNQAEQKRLGEVLAEGKLAQSGRLQLPIGHVRAGFRLVDLGVVILSDHQLFHRDESWQVRARRPPKHFRRYETRAIDSFLDLAEGDLVVHVGHGIARYRGMQILDRAGGGHKGLTPPAQGAIAPGAMAKGAEEHLVLEFAEGTKLYVPVSKIDLVQKYVGATQTEPHLSKLGGTSWQRRKEGAQEAVVDLASDMIELQAIRESQPGIPYPSDTEWQGEFEAAFPYEETRDQTSSMQEIKGDMERPRPMDRLVCGDVGYGKTELAIRAAFKAMDHGKQVAVLVPTTVLAEQHLRTFGDRLAEYPFVVECLSRFRSGAEQRSILQRLAGSGIDLVIGTHRLLSADVKFRDLGLVIIDEEQRFGVEHKDRLKKLRHTVDVLTLTATPIPRTLHLSLLGVRDISNLETPPRDRLSIETHITRYDPTLIRHAMLRELNREGQVYFVHNRVYNIQQVAAELRGIVPEARIGIIHGQMPEHELEEAMLHFLRRETDILVATTIIESGLDIPNANTIFIHQADQYGLADLHQLRGRVGRYKHRAYCYLLLDNERMISPVAYRRLKALEEFTELGAGFKIAMRDLEIRGAGNILGTQQSGHITAVGYELYCQLLDNAVRRAKNQPLKTPLEVTIDLPWRAYLPRDYVPGQKLKIEVYRRLSRIRHAERLADFERELSDRFGPLPEPALWLVRLQELRLLAARWHIAAVHREDKDIVFSYRNRRRIERLAEGSQKRLRVVDAQSAYFRLKPAEDELEALYQTLKALLQSTPRTL